PDVRLHFAPHRAGQQPFGSAPTISTYHVATHPNAAFALRTRGPAYVQMAHLRPHCLLPQAVALGPHWRDVQHLFPSPGLTHPNAPHLGAPAVTLPAWPARFAVAPINLLVAL